MNPAGENLYKKLHRASGDIALAQYCARFILRRGWLKRKRPPTYQQAAFTTALVVAYVRPFTKSRQEKKERWWPNFPNYLDPRCSEMYTEPEKKLHTELCKLRHTAYAHTLSPKDYPIKEVGRSYVLEQLSPQITKEEEVTLFLGMSAKLLKSIRAKMKELRAC